MTIAPGAAPTSTPSWPRTSPRNVYLNGETVRLDGALRFSPESAR
ncbi:MAG TPA: hypothetical protein VGG54_25190 [Trebonia sp.]